MIKKTSFSKSLILGISLLLGLFLLGIFIFKGLKTFSDKDRVVTVKGLAELNMMANSASISLNFEFSGNNLEDLIENTKNKKNAIIAYLTKTGYNQNDINEGKINVIDKQHYYEPQWVGDEKVEVKVDRYTISQNINIEVKSAEIKNTEDKKSQIEFDLVSKNLTCDINSSYIFGELNSIKPQLIAESTKNARIAGEQFANDSQAKLGKIKTASQGQISIVGTYNSYNDDDVVSSAPDAPYIQKARVVSTIVFFLE